MYWLTWHISDFFSGYFPSIFQSLVWDSTTWIWTQYNYEKMMTNRTRYWTDYCCCLLQVLNRFSKVLFYCDFSFRIVWTQSEDITIPNVSRVPTAVNSSETTHSSWKKAYPTARMVSKGYSSFIYSKIVGQHGLYLFEKCYLGLRTSTTYNFDQSIINNHLK